MKSFSFVIIILLCQLTIDCSKSLQFVGHQQTVSEKNYVVSIQWQLGHLCSGSIVAPQWVLTSAACIKMARYSPLTIRYGVLNCSEVDNSMATTRYIVSRNTSEHQALSLLMVDEAFNTTLISAFAKLPSPEHNIQLGDRGVVFGWDGTVGDTADLLKFTNFYVKQGLRFIHNHVVTEYEFEAGRIGTGITVGNVGSPFVTQNTIFGVASAISTYDGSLPDVFYRVNKFLEWINSTTGGIV